MLKADVLQVGLLGTCEYAPLFLFSLFAGVWVDRLPRRQIMIIVDICSALLLSLIPLLAIMGLLRIEYLYIIGFLTGTASVFFGIAYQSYLPLLVEAEDLIAGNSKLEISYSIARIGGPGIAGLLVQWLSAPLTIVFDVFSFLFSLLMLFPIRKPEKRLSKGDQPLRIVQEIKEGVQELATHSLLRAIALCSCMLNLFGTMILAVLTVYAVRDIHLTP